MGSISDPPFEETYKMLLDKAQNNEEENVVDEECQLPVIDLSRLEENSDEVAREECKSEIARASQEWGFFQVVNHGISSDIFNRLRCEQEKVFKQPFDKKTKEDKFLNFSAGSYRWGTPTATSITQLSWSEAFHIPLSDILGGSTPSNTTLRYLLITNFCYINILHHILRLLVLNFGYALFLFHILRTQNVTLMSDHQYHSKYVFFFNLFKSRLICFPYYLYVHEESYKVVRGGVLEG